MTPTVLGQPISPDGLTALARLLERHPSVGAALSDAIRGQLPNDGPTLEILLRKRILPPDEGPAGRSPVARFLRRTQRRHRQLHQRRAIPTEQSLREAATSMTLPTDLSPKLAGWWALIWRTDDAALRRDLWALCPDRAAIAQVAPPA